MTDTVKIIRGDVYTDTYIHELERGISIVSRRVDGYAGASYGMEVDLKERPDIEISTINSANSPLIPLIPAFLRILASRNVDVGNSASAFLRQTRGHGLLWSRDSVYMRTSRWHEDA